MTPQCSPLIVNYRVHLLRAILWNKFEMIHRSGECPLGIDSKTQAPLTSHDLA